MPACPHCHAELSGRDLGRLARFRPYRVCDRCGGRFTVDRSTRRRQMVAIGIALISLALTLQLYFEGGGWLWPAIASYAALGAVILHGNRLPFLVRWPERDDRDDTG